MIKLGNVVWFANPTAMLGDEPCIIVTAKWDCDCDGQMEKASLSFAFKHDPKTWERGLWQAIGGVSICRVLQTGFSDEEDVRHFSHHTVH